MGGKSELVTTSTNSVPAPTQEQLRIAHITQDNTMNDGEKAALLKMVRQVMEATKCNQFTAEIALYDSGNNVEEAVLAIIERNDEQETWTNSKNRKTKKAEKALEEKENFVEKPRGGFRGRGRGRSERPERDTTRDFNNRDSNNRDRETRGGGDRENRFDRENRQDREARQDGENRFERPERFERGERGNRSGRGRGASGTTRGGRGAGGGRGGSASTRPPRREDRERGQGNDDGFSMSTWDNNMQNTKEEDTMNGENEELNWSNTPLVFSRRDPQPQSQPQQQQQPVQTYASTAVKQPQEAGKPMSFAAAAAMRKKVEVVQPAPGPIEPPQRSYEKECQPSPSVSPQKPYQQQQSSLFGGSLDGRDNLNISRGSANNDQIGGLTFTNRAHAPQQGYSSADTVQTLTNQLKNDLGISINATPSSGANTSSNVANLLSSFQTSTGDAKPQQQPRFASTPQSSYTNTVEFVTGGDVSATATDYQFGFYADASPTTRENEVDSYSKQAVSYLASNQQQQTEISPKRLEIDHALSKLNHIDVSPAKSTAQAQTTQPTSYAPASHQTNGHSQQVQSQQDQLNKLRAGSGLSYANTTNLSYPNTQQQTTKTQQPTHHILTISHPDAQQQRAQQPPQQQVPQSNAQVQTQGYQAQQVAQQQQQLHHQQSPAQQQQTQQQQMSQAPLYPQAQNFAAYSNPYMSSYLNMNMYSPVTAGMRTDDAGMAAAFLGYPFMNQMDIASLTAMLPPAMASANASTAQAPPTMQSHLQQHTQPQHRADQQQQHYDNMPKTYSNQNLGAVTMANTQGNMASAQQQQQRNTMESANNSAVPPPPGFTGPPSNIPAATALFQPNLSSLFQMPASPYAPNLSAFPLMFNSPQHKIPTAMFQQPMDDGGEAQKMYGGQQQKMYQGQDKFGGKDRGLNSMSGAQPTPPPMAANNFAYGMGQMGHGMGQQQHKKNPYWNA